MSQARAKRRREERQIEQSIAVQIRLRRQEIGISETDAAALLKMTPKICRRLESGELRVSLGELCFLARYLYVSPSRFIDGF